MPKRTDINSILLIGSGPIMIGQACEFDYSGTQSVRTLKELGYRVILINSNPATIMTDQDFADATYIEPITEEVVEQIILKENIDAILPTMGGQTALNIATSMYDKGLLDNIKFLGATPEAIKKGEDRKLFKESMIKIGMDLAKSHYVYNMNDALKAQEDIGFPLIIRASFTLAGGGSGVAYNLEEYKKIVESGIQESPISEILVEESLLGWKEYEMEVIRDRKDNCIIVCSIENFDPMGVHTGDSITVAPSLTLTDKEYQNMRNASFDILREIGVDTGGSNVQFSINPKDGRMIVIEMNPRVSRSSALASKATGYPIAKVATLLAVGFTLDEINNDITGTTASFEPVIDYIVTKIPRFNFDKFPLVNTTLTTAMKSVGEVMAIGRTFKESIQKALCSLETGLYGFNKIDGDIDFIEKEIRRPNDKRILYLMEGMRRGFTNDNIFNLSKIDPWFISQIREIYNFEQKIEDLGDSLLSNEPYLRKAKSFGFSDIMIAKLINKTYNDIYDARKKLKINFQYNEVDTCSAEFKSLTPYLYSTTTILPPIDNDIITDGKKILILGGGPNRIGQGIEFDYCCVHAAFVLKEMRYKTIMYNCNPETVSTDYDISDILYFEPIDFEHVRVVIEREKPDGIIVHFGGQTPLKLSNDITNIGGNIIGTTAKIIDLTEDREKFSTFVKKAGLLQPDNGTAMNIEEAIKISHRIGYPILARPSFVLGGRGMKTIYNDIELRKYMEDIVKISNNKPILIDKFLDRAIELDVDCITDGKDVYIAGIMQHIEEAGIHSGDSACTLPPIGLSHKLIKEIEHKTKIMALELGVIGLMNTQYAIFNDKIYLIEVNPRASRTVPFVSKATGIPLAKVATRVMIGQSLRESLMPYDKNIIEEVNHILRPRLKNHIAVKESVFPFNKLEGSDLILGPEMKSTGEVMGISSSFGISFAKAQDGAKNFLPKSGGKIFLSLANIDKKNASSIATELIETGFMIIATTGTYQNLLDNNIECEHVLKVSEGRPNIHDSILNNDIKMAINTTNGKEISKQDGVIIRRMLIKMNIPYITTISGVNASIEALKSMKKIKCFQVKSIQEFLM